MIYTTYNNEQLKTAQDSGLGINVSNQHVAAIGQSDDIVLLSHDVHFLSNLLQLSLDYCRKHHVTLAPEKTKLVPFFAKRHTQLVKYQKMISPISIDNIPIKFVSSTEHVGVIRSSSGNLPHIQNRISSHNKALYSVLPAGLARNHNANPAASLRVEALYALPVLLSGVAPLILSKDDVKVIHSHHKNVLQNIQKLPKNTPESVILFLAGSPGATAHIHLRQLGLFGMICRLPQNILHKIATDKLLTELDNSSSWFIQIRHLCRKYNFPSPLTLLSKPPSKASFKSLVKAKVIDFWEIFIRQDALSKSSLKYFQPNFMSLQLPHPIWTTCKNNSFEVNKAVAVVRLLSGRYMTDWLCRKWSKENPSGHCILCPGKNLPGDINHFLLSCQALSEKRNLLLRHIEAKTEHNQHLSTLVTNMMNSSADDCVQFLLDPSVVPAVITGVQNKLFTLDMPFALTRTFIYGMHRRRLQLIGRFNTLR